jgi:large subunit ribosomal protein L4
MNVTVKTSTGKDAGTIELPDEFFAREPNISLLNQVVLAQLAAARQGTQQTKSRSEVSGGGAKPWRQKGTGRARAGSSRSPIWRGGGMSHALRPRDYSQKTPKKMVRAALLQALSDRAQDNKIVVIDNWNIDAPKTKEAIKVLEALSLRTSNVKEKLPRLLVVVHHTEENVWKSLRGLSDQVQLVLPREINAYDVLCSDYVVFSSDTLESVLRVLRKDHITSFDPMDKTTIEDIIDAGVEALEAKEGAK